MKTNKSKKHYGVMPRYSLTAPLLASIARMLVYCFHLKLSFGKRLASKAQGELKVSFTMDFRRCLQ